MRTPNAGRAVVLKKRTLRVGARPIAVGEAARDAQARAPGRGGVAGGHPEHAPVVTMRRNGDLIEALEVTCPCGHAMVIECLYGADASGGST